jgi:hypothetical protein
LKNEFCFFFSYRLPSLTHLQHLYYITLLSIMLYIPSPKKRRDTQAAKCLLISLLSFIRLSIWFIKIDKNK